MPDCRIERRQHRRDSTSKGDRPTHDERGEGGTRWPCCYEGGRLMRGRRPQMSRTAGGDICRVAVKAISQLHLCSMLFCFRQRKIVGAPEAELSKGGVGLTRSPAETIDLDCLGCA